MTFFTLSHTRVTSPSPAVAARPFTWVSALVSSDTMSLRNSIWVTVANSGLSPSWPSTLVTVMVTFFTATLEPRLMVTTLWPALRLMAYTPSGAAASKGISMVLTWSSSSYSTRAVPAWMAPCALGEEMEISLISVGLSRVMGMESSSGLRVTTDSLSVNRSATLPSTSRVSLSTVGTTMAVVERMRGSAARSIILLT